MRGALPEAILRNEIASPTRAMTEKGGQRSFFQTRREKNILRVFSEDKGVENVFPPQEPYRRIIVYPIFSIGGSRYNLLRLSLPGYALIRPAPAPFFVHWETIIPPTTRTAGEKTAVLLNHPLYGLRQLSRPLLDGLKRLTRLDKLSGNV